MRDSEDVVNMCAADHYLADCAMHRRDYTLAEQHRLSALETALTSENVMQQAIEIHGLALTAAGLGRDKDALRLEGAVDAKYEELGVSSPSSRSMRPGASATSAQPVPGSASREPALPSTKDER